MKKLRNGFYIFVAVLNVIIGIDVLFFGYDPSTVSVGMNYLVIAVFVLVNMYLIKYNDKLEDFSKKTLRQADEAIQLSDELLKELNSKK